MSGPMFSGSITALITPFRDGQLDEDAFQRFVEWQIEEGTSALVSCGTTGESPTLTHEEDMREAAELGGGHYIPVFKLEPEINISDPV